MSERRNAMKNIKALFGFVVACASIHILGHQSLYPARSIRYNCDYEWAIVGAGPAGIILIGLLLDLGTDPKSIVWIEYQSLTLAD